MIKYLRPLLARNRDENHRAATELELLFDLVSVIAIAAAALIAVSGYLPYAPIFTTVLLVLCLVVRLRTRTEA